MDESENCKVGEDYEKEKTEDWSYLLSNCNFSFSCVFSAYIHFIK